VKYAYILEHQLFWTVSGLCRALQVSSQGYYAWLKRPLSPRAQANQELDPKIIEFFDVHKSRYGAVRITEELKAQGETASENRVAKRMKVLQLKAKQAKKFKVTTDILIRELFNSIMNETNEQ
jgi:putative transposase